VEGDQISTVVDHGNIAPDATLCRFSFGGCKYFLGTVERQGFFVHYLSERGQADDQNEACNSVHRVPLSSIGRAAIEERQPPPGYELPRLSPSASSVTPDFFADRPKRRQTPPARVSDPWFTLPVSSDRPEFH